MSAPAVIKATFADYRRVKTRKVAQLVLEIPLEQLHEAVAALGGEPSVNEDTWVAVARLVEPAKQEPRRAGEPAPSPTGTGKRFRDLPLPQQAGIACDDPRFREYLVSTYPDAGGEPIAIVRTLCGVMSRAELATQPTAGNRWLQLYAAYELWRDYPDLPPAPSPAVAAYLAGEAA